jgi:sialate O-acetylesterase
MKTQLKRLIVISFCLITRCCANAQIKLPQIIRDSMVLQRDAKINIWGWALQGEKVTVKFNGKTYKATTGNDGKWMLQLPSIKAGGPYNMEISGKNKIVLHNILVGDVWLCAGQSNMEHQMKLHNVYYSKEIANANYP